MLDYVLKRVLLAAPVAFGVLVLVFVLMHLIPGDPVEVMLGESASAADREELREALHLNDPLTRQFWYFVRDLSTNKLESVVYREPVLPRIFERLGSTAILSAAAMAVSLLLSLPLGIAAATRKNSALDHAAMGFSMIGVSMPNFWLGPMLMLLFSLKLGLLPVSGGGSLRHLVLPAATLGFGMAAIVSRMTRGSLLDVLGSEYLRAARAKGLSERAVVLKHALKNALVPVITIVGLQAGALLSGAIITETIFAWPGVGKLLIDAIQARDFPMVQAAVIVIALCYVVVNLCTDLLYAAADPRVRYTGGARG